MCWVNIDCSYLTKMNNNKDHIICGLLFSEKLIFYKLLHEMTVAVTCRWIISMFWFDIICSIYIVWICELYLHCIWSYHQDRTLKRHDNKNGAAYDTSDLWLFSSILEEMIWPLTFEFSYMVWLTYFLKY